MCKKSFRILIACRTESDRTALAEAIKQAGLAAELSSVSPNDLVSALSGKPFDGLIIDGIADDKTAGKILRAVPAARLICIVNPVNEAVADTLLRQGADVVIKDPAGLYLKLLPLKMQIRLDVLGPAVGDGGPQADLWSGEYQQLTRMLFEHSPNMIFINAAGRVAYANEKCVEVMGYTRQEFYSPDFDFLKLIAPECAEVVKANFARHLRGEEVEPYDYTLVDKSGRRIEAIMSSKLIQYGGRRAILGIITDISHRKKIEEEIASARNELERHIAERTEALVKTNESLLTEIKDRQRAEKALRQSEERFRTISTLTSDYVYSMSCGQDNSLEWISGAFQKITGYDVSEVTCLDDWLRTIHPDDVDIIRKSEKARLGGQVMEGEYRIRTKQGQIRWLSDRAYPVVDEKTGRVTAIVGGVRDITEHKKAMEALRESEQRFKAIFENAGGAIFIADAETGYLIECNAKAEELTGLTRDKLIGLHQTKLHAPEDTEKYRTKFKQNVREGSLLDYECEILHADGRRIPVWISTQVMSFAERKVILGLFIDVSARRRADLERARFTEMLEEKNHELESIIHVAGHDLRTPLITISGFAGELQRSCRQLQDLCPAGRHDEETAARTRAIVSEDIPEAVNLIQASAAKLNALLDGMTRLARFEPAGAEMAVIDMNAMLADIIKTLTYEARNRAVKFQVEQLPECWGDEQQINQVFSNLLGNALKYLDPARPGRIAVSGRQAEDHTLYCVQDNGIGIDENNLPHIFKMYYRVDPRPSDGQGLGLAIVRRILSRHNGKVWAESEEGVGSRFFVALPNSPA